MSPILIIVVAVLIALVGLLAATRMRRMPRDPEVLAALGFRAGGEAGAFVAAWRGRAVTAKPTRARLELHTPLAPSPLAYDVMARALGRGDLLALAYQLEARSGLAELDARVAPNLPAKSLRRELDRLVALADALERLPQAEGMARWFMELSEGGDREAALARLIAAFPETPETLAACRAEREQARDQRAAALARRHLAAVERRGA